MASHVGVDIVDLKRLKLDHLHFIKHVLTDKEYEIFESLKSDQRKIEYLGGRFASKEAVLKAIGTGIGGMKFKDIEILNEPSGKPYLNIPNSSISISHDGGLAIAMVIIED